VPYLWGKMGVGVQLLKGSIYNAQFTMHNAQFATPSPFVVKTA